MSKLNIMFLGTPEFSVSSLKILHEELSEVNVVKVISMPDRKAGRGKKMQSPAVIEYARDQNLSFFQTANINKEEELLKELESSSIDIIIVIAFSQFLGSRILNIPRIGPFNIHTSLLPKYRGAAPIQYALLNGDKVTGVSIQKMVKKMDAGDIVYSHEVNISEEETSQTLFTKLESEASLGLRDFINEVIGDESSLNFLPQDESKASFAPIISKTDGLIKPLEESSNKIFNKSKAYFPWPGTYIYINDQRLKVINCEMVKSKVNAGTISTALGTLVVGTIDGSIRLKTVQLDGKKPISDSEYINGAKNKFPEFIITSKD